MLERIDQNVVDQIRFANTNTYRNRNMVVGYAHTLTPSLVNDFRIGWERFDTAALN